MKTNIEALKDLYVALGGTGTDYTAVTIPEALNSIGALLGSSAVNQLTPDCIEAIATAITGKSVVTLEEKNVTANGTYTAASGKAYSKVKVEVE